MEDDLYIYPEGLPVVPRGAGYETILARLEFRGGLPESGGYGNSFENDTFMIHPYCWCEEDGCKWCEGVAPNFWYKPTDFKIWWYKYPFRGANWTAHISLREFDAMISSCIESLEK